MKDGRQFDTEREYEKYVQDLIKSVEMLNLLLEANLFYKKIRNNRVTAFFAQITEKMERIRATLKTVKLIAKDHNGVTMTSNFYAYDFSIPLYEFVGNLSNNSEQQIVLPEYEKSDENMSNVTDAKKEITEFVET
mmetsp:Transcript_11181/g.12608  ORF Transcript_11181/g.12608 Transcript_11181/m.12608 type:complete len:135 (-) Transcript_11181:409-813(-)